MASNVFDRPPLGYARSQKKGWLVVAPTPQKKSIDKIKAENEELKERLASLEDAVEQLVSKKKK